MAFIYLNLNFYILAYSALERQLESLGRRWGDVCRWAEEHWLTLQDALSKWKSFADKQTRFSDWLTKAEGSLSQMPPISQADFNQITDQVRQLKASSFPSLVFGTILS